MKLITAHKRILKSILRNYDTRDPAVKKAAPGTVPLSPGKVAYLSSRRDEVSANTFRDAQAKANTATRLQAMKAARG